MNFRESFWIEDGTRELQQERYFCRREDLERAIADTGLPENTIRLRLGNGFFHLGEALEGRRLSINEINLIEGVLYKGGTP
jgi:hypothetical protein